MKKFSGLAMAAGFVSFFLVVNDGNALAAGIPDFLEKSDNIQEKLDICCGGLPKTGQTESYVEGDDGDLRKGISWPEPSFTDNNDDTVTDNLTQRT